LVGHWYPYGETGALAEMSYGWIDPDSQTGWPTARVIVVEQSYPQIRRALQSRAANGFISLHKTRRRV
jgi:hypothetical protein